VKPGIITYSDKIRNFTKISIKMKNMLGMLEFSIKNFFYLKYYQTLNQSSTLEIISKHLCVSLLSE
jgi:hypothetical protein